MINKNLHPWFLKFDDILNELNIEKKGEALQVTSNETGIEE